MDQFVEAWHASASWPYGIAMDKQGGAGLHAGLLTCGKTSRFLTDSCADSLLLVFSGRVKQAYIFQKIAERVCHEENLGKSLLLLACWLALLVIDN